MGEFQGVPQMKQTGRILAPVASDSLTITPTGQVVRSVIHGQPVQFFIANPSDTIQRVHARGEFYEPEELDIIRRWCPPGAIFCDIGSNVGNHAIYALKFMHASRVILFEPNPDAIALLLTNLGLNGLLPRCDTAHLGFGLSDHSADGKSIEVSGRNLGGGHITDSTEPAGGSISLRRGDDLLADVSPDFLKIDVEGMEIAVLAGLAELIARCRPIIFIEVDNRNREAFLRWVADNQYAARATFRRYRANENFLLVPRRIRPAAPAPTDDAPAEVPEDTMADAHDAPVAAPEAPFARARSGRGAKSGSGAKSSAGKSA